MRKIELSTFVALIVTIVWAASFVADIFISSYDPSPFIHLAMMTIVGAIFGKNFLINQQVNDSVNPPDPPTPKPATPSNPVPEQ
jgi:hypothetical protein